MYRFATARCQRIKLVLFRGAAGSAAVLGLVWCQAQSALATPAAPLAQFSVATVYGSGCPTGTFRVFQSANREFVNVAFARFRVDASAAISGRVADCTALLTVDRVKGWSYQLRRFSVSGAYHLTKSARGELSYTSGVPQALETGKDIYGSNSAADWRKSYQRMDDGFSDCGRADPIRISLNLRALRVGDEGSVGIASVNSLNVSSSGVEWKKCE